MSSRIILVAAASLACALAQAQPVVRVLAVKGAPVVLANGVKTKAAPGVELAKADRIAVPMKSWLVLQVLANDYVVKIDEDLEMPVSDIAVLDAPKRDASLDEHLRAMVRTKELEEADRVTAYQNRRVAGDAPVLRGVPPSRAAVKKDAAAKRSAPAARAVAPMSDDRMEESSAAGSPPPAPPPPPAPAVDGKGGPGAAPAQVSGKREVSSEVAANARPKFKAKAPQPAFRWARVVDGATTEQASALDPAIAHVLADPEFSRCIRAAWTDAGLALPARDHLLLRRVGGKVQARLGSRLAFGAECAKGLDEKLAAVAAQVPDRGWLRVEMGLAGP